MRAALVRSTFSTGLKPLQKFSDQTGAAGVSIARGRTTGVDDEPSRVAKIIFL